jgi:hypothetical protein
MRLLSRYIVELWRAAKAASERGRLFMEFLILLCTKSRTVLLLGKAGREELLMGAERQLKAAMQMTQVVDFS